MSELPFSLDLMHWLAEHRSPALTAFFTFFTFVGELEGYILLVVLAYVAFDKRLAVRLALVTLASMSLNHVLKTLIANPRPFVAQGEHLSRWAVTPAKAADLATEFSTPSGHAMGSAAFYTTLYDGLRYVRTRRVAIACIVLVLLIGLSRPYLGVHYLEDVLLGWPIGAALAWLLLRSGARLGDAWYRLSLAQQAALLAGGSALVCAATRALGAWRGDSHPTAFVSYAGLLSGVLLGQRLEIVHVSFESRRGSVGQKLLRYALALALVVGTLAGLDPVFEALAADATPAGDVLRWLRYAAAAVGGVFVAPLLFLRLGIAEQQQPH
jgi:membrane-associated phospholipid phosphatase